MRFFRQRQHPSVNAHTPLREQPASAWGTRTRNAAARGERAVAADLRRKLLVLAARHETGEFDGAEIALVVQAHRNMQGSYKTWRHSWDRRLRQMTSPSHPRGHLSADRWPAEVITGGWSMILLGVGPQTTTMVDRRPLKFKGAQAPPRRREALLAEPRVAFTTKAVTVQRTSPELMAMDLVSELLGWTGDLEAPRLAPPALEWVTADCRRQLAREVLSWDLPWHLSASAAAL
jgi:hypothetical protein